MTLRVGLVGTSWWADSMYLPALASHPDGQITALCGRDPGRLADRATQWGISSTFTEWQPMLDEVDAVIIATPNDTHEPIAVAALERGLHVLCEKPLAGDLAGARRIAAAAAASSATTMTPFTYRWMPANQWVKQLIDEGYIGTPYHLNLRYHTGYGRNSTYAWRFDQELAGSGVIGDLGTHWLHLARWWFGEAVGMSAFTDTMVRREPRADGSDYVQCEDAALMTLKFANGAHGSLQVTCVGWEGDGFGQQHNAELHGSEGTLYLRCDWDKVQVVSGIRGGAPGRVEELPIPDSLWGGARRDTVHNTYRDVFRMGDTMTREWLSAAARGQQCQPDFAEGLRVQVLADAAVRSAQANSIMIAI